MFTYKILLVGILITSPLVAHGGVNPKDIEGNWACDPYTMTNAAMTVTVTEYRTYDRSGNYEELGTSVIKAANGLTLTTKSTLSGSWSVDGDILSLSFTSGQFLDSSNTNYTIAMGQAVLDEGLKKRAGRSREYWNLGSV